MNDEYMTSREAAAYIRMKYGTLAVWRSKGIGPRFFRVGNKIFYKRSDLDAWWGAHAFTCVTQYGEHNAPLLPAE